MMRASTFDRIVCGKIIHRSFHGSLYIYTCVCVCFRIQKTENGVAFEFVAALRIILLNYAHVEYPTCPFIL